MKKWLILPVCLLFILGAGLLTVAAATQGVGPGAVQGSDPAIDPEPPVEQAPPGAVPQDATIEAILEPAWVAPASSETNHLAWGDYDRDGDLDLLVGNYGENVLYTNIGRALTPTLTFLCEPGMSSADTRAIEWGDFDRDGYLDVAIGNFARKNCIFHNEGNGTFARDWLAEVRQNTTSVAWAGWEIGGESLSFLAVGNSGDANAVYRYEAGDFDLWWRDPPGATEATQSVAWGDYDEDGYPDLAVGNFGQPTYVFHNDPAGQTLQLVYSTTVPSYTTSIAWGDVDGDGLIDLAVGNSGTTGEMHHDYVLRNTGSVPVFEWPPYWTSGDASPTTDVSWGDYDGDGDLDLASASEPDGVTRVYVNNGGMLAAFPAREFDDEVLERQDVAWADWDGDGDLDLAIGYFGAPVTVYDNTAGPMFSADVSPH
ncbi:MAG: FG-GAP repeat domain-containing protein, partial [Anaerolineae bacterium]